MQSLFTFRASTSLIYVCDTAHASALSALSIVLSSRLKNIWNTLCTRLCTRSRCFRDGATFFPRRSCEISGSLGKILFLLRLLLALLALQGVFFLFSHVLFFLCPPSVSPRSFFSTVAAVKSFPHAPRWMQNTRPAATHRFPAAFISSRVSRFPEALSPHNRTSWTNSPFNEFGVYDHA